MRYRIFSCLACLAILGVAFRLQAQPQSITPVSPEASALAKMVNYPINMNSGVPDITIPFYKISVGGMELPITFVYHAGGFKINEHATRVGLGWSLNSNLQITRSINGLDDFIPNTGYVGNTLVKVYDPSTSNDEYPIWSVSPWPYMNAYDLAKGVKDGTPDKFNYQLLNKSGSFYFMKNTAGTGYTIMPVPYDNIKITYSNGQFIIVDTDGTTYYYGEQGSTSLDNLADEGKEVTGSIDPLMTTCTDCHVTAWKCLRIENHTGSDQITFTYTPKSVIRYRTFNDYIEYYNNANPCNLDAYYRSDEYPINTVTDYNNLVYLVPFYEISSPKYMEVFGGSSQSKFHVPYLDAQDNVIDKVYTKSNGSLGATTDIAGLSLSMISFRGGKVQFNGNDQLSTVTVLDSKDNTVKSVSLYQSYTNATFINQAKNYNGVNFQGTLYLDSIHVNNGGMTYGRYAFLYNEKFCYGNHLKGHDAWGYPNASTVEIAASSGTFSLPTKKVNQDRYYHEITSGCTDFVSNVLINLGGDNWAEAPDETAMRRGVLHRIIYPTGGFVDFDFEANQYQETFSYDNDIIAKLPQLAGGLRIRSISHYNEHSTLPEMQKYYRYGQFGDGMGILINKPRIGLESGVYYYDAVDYDQLIAYLATATGIPSCPDRSCVNVKTVEKKTTYRPASYLDYTYANGSPIYYTEVTEYRKDFGVQSGKTVHEYYPPDQFMSSPATLINENRIPNTNIPYIKADGLMGAEKSISEYKYDAAKGFELLHYKGYEYQRYLKQQQVRVAYAFLHVMYNIVSGNFSGTDRDLYNQTYSLPAIQDQDYVAGQYGIPIGKLLLSKETEQSFDGSNVLTQTTQYYYDNPSYVQPSRIVHTDSKGNAIAHTLKYAYDFDGIYDDMEARNMINAPVEDIETNMASGLEISRKKTNYDEISEGFGFLAPVSVQSSYGGGSLVTDLQIDKYDQYGNVLQRTGRDGIPTSYLWGYEGLYPVAELKGVKYADIPVSFLSNVQITNPSDDNTLRTVLTNLRNSFSGNKQINSFTYKRLVGLTSQADANGYNTYYDYDAIGRLVDVKDQDQNIRKTHDYKMVGPSASNMVPWYVNIPMMQTKDYFCESSYLYQLYSFIVPGGTYRASTIEMANTMAESDLESGDTPPAVCAGSPNVGEVKMAAIYDPSHTYPYGAYIDFVKNGVVVATQSFPVNITPISTVQYKTLHLPEGTYQINLRPNPNTHYTTDVFRCYFTATDESYNVEVQAGGSVTIVANKCRIAQHR